MPQLATQADGLIDTITTQKEALASLTQTVARGVPALRDAAENVLELNPATTTPLLTSNANDIGLSYSSAVLSVVDQTGQEQRPLTADRVDVGDGATGINAGGMFGPSATLSDYLYVVGPNNSYTVARGGDLTTTGALSVTNITLGDTLRVGGTTINSGGLSVGNMWLNGSSVNAPFAGLGGVNFANNGLSVGNTWLDGASVNATRGGIGGVFLGNNGLAVGNTWLDGTSLNAPRGGIGGVFLGNNGLAVGNTWLDGASVNATRGGIGGVNLGNGGLSMGNTWIDGGGFNGAYGGIGGVFLNRNGVDAAWVNAGVLSYTALVPPPSERAMKTEESLIRNGLDVVRMLVPARWRWREQPTLGGKAELAEDHDLHASVYVDEVAEAAPELIVTRHDGSRGYDERGLTAYLISAVQTLADQVATLTARLDALEAT